MKFKIWIVQTQIDLVGVMWGEFVEDLDATPLFLFSLMSEASSRMICQPLDVLLSAMSQYTHD